jgi:hypothetical protein
MRKSGENAFTKSKAAKSANPLQNQQHESLSHLGEFHHSVSIGDFVYFLSSLRELFNIITDLYGEREREREVAVDIITSQFIRKRIYVNVTGFEKKSRRQ